MYCQIYYLLAVSVLTTEPSCCPFIPVKYTSTTEIENNTSTDREKTRKMFP